MSSLRLGVVSDVHLVFDRTNRSSSRVSEPDDWDFPGTEARLQAAVERLEHEGVAGVVVLGDLAHHGDAETLDHALASLARLQRPLWAAPGNHDVALRADAVADSLRRAGHHDAHELQAGCRLAIVELESVDWILRCRSRSALAVGSWGADLVLVASHFPLLPPPSGDDDPDHLADGEDVLRTLLERVAPTIVLSGHLHQRLASSSGRVLQLVFPAVVGDPAACSIVELTERDGRHRFLRNTLSLGAPFAFGQETWELDGHEWLELSGDRIHEMPKAEPR